MQSIQLMHLVALDSVLFDLVKLALELSLALQPLLSSAYIDDFPIDLLSIHLINCLENKRKSLNTPDCVRVQRWLSLQGNKADLAVKIIS